MSITDIRNTNIQSNKVFVVDTNALLWTFYPNLSYNNSNSANYSNFISQIIGTNCELHILAFNMSEFMYVVEKNECDIYNQNQTAPVKLKQFRHIQSERAKVKRIIDLTYSQIKNIPNVKIISEPITSSSVECFVNTFNTNLLDFFDFCICEYCIRENCALITDDADFLTKKNDIEIYTSNNRLLNQ